MMIGRDKEQKKLLEAERSLKYVNAQFVISEAYEQDLLNKVDAYQRETKTESSILLTMITARGVKPNSHSGCVQKELVAEDLFR